MDAPRPILTEPGPRPVFVAWLIVLVAAAVLAFAAGGAQLQKLRRAQAIADSNQQLDRLYSLLVVHYGSSRAVFEHDALGGYRLPGEPYALTAEIQDAQLEEGRLFRFSARESVTTPSPFPQMVLRTTIDASLIDPQFAAWTLRLKFVDDRLAGASAVSGARAAYRRPITGLVAVQRAVEAMLVVSAGAALLCLLVASSVEDRWRRQVAAIGLAAAVLALLAVNLHPTRDARPVLRDPYVQAAWAMAIGALGMAALLPPRSRRQGDRTRCRCGYDLTGNVSGICPECGRPTPRGRIDRWAETAAAIESLPPVFTGPYLTSPLLTEVKPPGAAADLRRFSLVMAGSKWACYRYSMTNARLGPEAEDEGPDGVPADANEMSYGSSGAALQSASCPNCATEFDVDYLPDSGVLMCPACGGEFIATVDQTDENRELSERMEVERRTKEVELDRVRVKQVLTERRSLFRLRTYFIVTAVTSAVAAVQLGIWCYARLARGDADLYAAGYIAAIVGLLIAKGFCVGRTRALTRELGRPAQAEPAVEPDFSTLSDGSQRLDAAAQNLAKLYDRGN